MSALLTRKNFAEAPLATAGINDSSTTLNLATGGGAEFPTPGAAGFYITVWNNSDYPGAPYSDPNVERMKVTAISTDALTVTRGQDGTAAVAHNTVNKVYHATLSLGKAELDNIELHIQGGSMVYAVTTGSANAFVATLDPAPAALVAGLTLRLKPNFSNTGAATLNVNGLGAVAIQQRLAAPLQALAIVSGCAFTVVYDGTAFVLQSPDVSVFEVQNGSTNYAVTTGSANAFVAALSPAPTALVAGLVLRLKPNFSPTGACTLNVNGLGATAIRDRNLAPIRPGAILTGQAFTVVYDGAFFVLQSADVSAVEIQNGGMLTATTAGSATVYTLALTPAPSAYATGQTFRVIVDETSGAAPTINIDSLGAKNLLDREGSALIGGELCASGVYTLFYDGTGFRVLEVLAVSEIHVSGAGTAGAGYGSTNTKIRRFTTVEKNVGASITLTQDATNGDSFTINKAGRYTISQRDIDSVANTFMGCSKNSAQLTTNIQSATVADVLMGANQPQNRSFQQSVTVNLLAGDVIRHHNGTSVGIPVGTTDFNVDFRITRVG